MNYPLLKHLTKSELHALEACQSLKRFSEKYIGRIFVKYVMNKFYKIEFSAMDEITCKGAYKFKVFLIFDTRNMTGMYSIVYLMM
ncbi:hypothetical protein HZS_60 [Henneguya salminicola]|nr:hypothetical protein HZS_60 [Henneguya salminicola]